MIDSVMSLASAEIKKPRAGLPRLSAYFEVQSSAFSSLPYCDSAYFKTSTRKSVWGLDIISQLENTYDIISRLQNTYEITRSLQKSIAYAGLK